MPDATLLISTAGTRSSGQWPGPGRTELADSGQGVVVGESQDPDAGRGSGIDQCSWLEHAVRAPAVGVQVDAGRGYSGTSPVDRGHRARCWRRSSEPATATSDLDEALDPLDGDGAAADRVDVDQTGVEDDRARSRPRTASAGR